jgi:hypothetical protein
MRCVRCNGSGVCATCKGSGRSGFFLLPPAASSPLCWCCKGLGKCDRCAGTARIAEPKFRPRINVRHSQRVPQPIFAAVLTGAPWRFLEIPDAVLRRGEQAQQGYVAWRCRTHYRETQGRCFLFGSITGFEWVRSQRESIIFDIHGRVTAAKQKPSVPGTGSLTIGNKAVELRTDGTLRIDAATREDR